MNASMFKNPEFKESLLGNLPEFKDYIFGDKGNAVSKLLEKEGVIQFPIDSSPENAHKWIVIQMACCYAYNDKFVENTVRKRYDNIIIDKEIESQIRAIRKLQKFHNKNSNVTLPAILNAFSDLKINKNDIPTYGNFDHFLDQYADGLQKWLDQVTGKQPPEEKTSWPYGGLLFFSDLPFGRSIKRQGDIKKQSLLFHLAYIFRHITSNNLETMKSPAGPMPKFGKPRYTLSGEIAQKVLGKIVTENSAQKIVKNLVEKGVWYFDPMCADY